MSRKIEREIRGSKEIERKKLGRKVRGGREGEEWLYVNGTGV